MENREQISGAAGVALPLTVPDESRLVAAYLLDPAPGTASRPGEPSRQRALYVRHHRPGPGAVPRTAELATHSVTVLQPAPVLAMLTPKTFPVRTTRYLLGQGKSGLGLVTHVGVQLPGDDQAVSLAEALATLAVDGTLPMEPCVETEAASTWRDTAEEIAFGLGAGETVEQAVARLKAMLASIDRVTGGVDLMGEGEPGAVLGALHGPRGGGIA